MKSTNWRLTLGSSGKKITGRLRSRWYIVDQAVPGSGLRLLVAIERQCVYDNDFHHQWSVSASGAALPLAGWVGRLIRASQDSDTPLAYWPNTREQSILSVIEYIYMQISIRHPPGYFYSHKSMCLSKGTMETQASLAFYERWHASTWNFVFSFPISRYLVFSTAKNMLCTNIGRSSSTANHPSSPNHSWSDPPLIILPTHPDK